MKIDKANNLINESSPYLLQHAYNPVNWYPWGEEAFAKSKNENKPIFLSIGYSSCHWCHVMERESFEDIEVAEVLNNHFVSIKVDKEERPDVDHFYMSACTTLTGQGGWPLSVFLTPELKPFYAGTYFPKNDAYGRAGFISVLKSISDHWHNDNRKILESSISITNHIESSESREKVTMENVADTAFKQFDKSFDSSYGGFGKAPKFPSPHNLIFLLRYGLVNNNQKAFDMVGKTLDCMYEGGLYDHIGGGFCRNSTDRKWLVPHFEKMMYDNAMLLTIYAEASRSINTKYTYVVNSIVDYCMSEMTNDSIRNLTNIKGVFNLT